MSATKPNFLDLPVELVEKIFSYMNYETISKNRSVCRYVNEISSSMLNTVFQRLQALMLQRFQKIKGQMPRRESARRKHPLARESDIIETLHMRLTLLQMSFGKHIERKHCCFFAGEILDEVYRIMRYVKVTSNLARAYKVTDELFDLSTMAMEYFKERIEPTLPEITYFSTDFLELNTFTNSPGSSTSITGSLNQSNLSDDIGDSPQSNITIKKKLRRFRQDMKRHNKRQSSMLKELKRCQSRVIKQEKQINEMSSRFEDFSKKNEGSACKFNAVLQELNKCKTELQYWRSKSPASQLCNSCSTLLSVKEEHRDAVDMSSDNYLEMFLLQKPGTSDFIPISSTSYNTSESFAEKLNSSDESKSSEENSTSAVSVLQLDNLCGSHELANMKRKINLSGECKKVKKMKMSM